jgi:hypothetical protein
LLCCEFFVQVFHSQLFCSALQKIIDVACWTFSRLRLVFYNSKEKKNYWCNILSKSWILGIKELLGWLQNVCKIYLSRIFLITYNRHQEIICGQHTWQIKITKFDFLSNLTIYWDLYLRISIPLISQSTKHG